MEKGDDEYKQSIHHHLFPYKCNLFRACFGTNDRIIYSRLKTLPIIVMRFNKQTFRFTINKTHVVAIRISLVILFPLFNRLVLYMIGYIIV